jgi:RNA polymerase sigma-70 factor (ECF subfamily)
MLDSSDSELMREVRRGRTGALATLFERHHARLYRYCVRMTGNPAVSEDLVQDVFMKMLKYKATFRDDSTFLPWMFGIARNACIAYLRRASVDLVPEEELERAPLEDASDDDHAAEQQADLVRRALLALPIERREVLVLSRYEFKTHEEIARSLGCSVVAVRVRVHRAIKQLREIYFDLAGETST